MSAAEQSVLDPASGSRMFYFDPGDPRVVFGDIRSESHTLCDGRALEIAPDIVMDFRAVPYPDEQFRVVVFDPPHLTRVGVKGWMFKKYGGLNVTTWKEDLAAGFAECFRVLAPNGVLIFKWNETQIPVGDVLALTPHAPLVGHRRVGKSADTHWITFLKAPPREDPPRRDAVRDLLTRHRDDHYPAWCKERGVLNFAIWLCGSVGEGS